MEQKRTAELTSAGLHLLAMGLMLCDHLWAMLFPAAQWLTWLGRIAFPIFAFMAVEGYFHTRNLRRYLLRLLVWALLSEIPFDLMYGGSMFYPYHQNVIWTLLLGLLLVALLEKIREFRPLLRWMASAGVVVLGFCLGYAAMIDYYGAGVLTVLTFCFFRQRNWKSFLGQLLCLYILNVELLGGYYTVVTVLGHEVEVVQQGMALLALLPIWLYRGRQGCRKTWFQYACYAFYPLHMLILVQIQRWMLG